MSKFKVLYLLNRWGIGGISNYIADIVSLLDKNRFEALIACIYDSNEKRIDTSGVNITSLSPCAGHRYDPRILSRLTYLLKMEKVDCIESNGPLCGFLGFITSRIAGVNGLIYTAHTQESIYRFTTQLLLGIALSRYNHIFAVSKTVLEDLKAKAFYAKTITSRVEILATGVNTDKIHPKSPKDLAELRRKWRLAPDAFIMVSSMRIVTSKRPFDLIRVLELISDILPNSQLVIIGDGPERDRVEAKARESGCSSKLVLTGMVSREHVFEILKAADCYISTTELEGAPISFLEAMAVGLPIVTTRYGPHIDDIVEHGSTGFTVELGDTRSMAEFITKIAMDPCLAGKLGTEARTKVQNQFNLSNTVQRRQQVYDELRCLGHGK